MDRLLKIPSPGAKQIPTSLLAAVIAGLIVVGPARADTLEDDHALDMDFETPHTDWAQPYARGKIRVLYFTNVPFAGYYCKPRRMIELMQRSI